MAKSPDKLFADQFDDEEVLMVFRKHPVVMRVGLIIASFAILLGTIPALIKPEFSWFFGGLAGGFVLSILVFSPYWISWYYSVFIVTNQRFLQITQKGLFTRSMVGINITQIQMVNYEVAGIQETLLGFGTLVLQTYVGSLTIHEVHHPGKMQKELLQILRSQGVNTTGGPLSEEDGGSPGEELALEE